MGGTQGEKWRKILVEKSGGTTLARCRLRHQDNIKTKLKEVSFFDIH